MSERLTEAEREALWDVIARVRDAAPRLPDDAETDDIIDAILDSGLLHRIIAARVEQASAGEGALREFVKWVAINRAYNGSDYQHGQSLYNECINAALPEWAEDFLRAALTETEARR